MAKERFWRRAIQRQQQCGLTVSAFCAAEGLKSWSFHWWRRELAKREREKPATKAAEKPKSRPSFVPVQLLSDHVYESSIIEVGLNSGQRVRIPAGFDPQTLDSLLTVLGSHPF